MLIFVFRAIQHPNILCLLGTMRDESSLMIVTNYVEGMDLQTILFNEDVERVYKISVYVFHLTMYNFYFYKQMTFTTKKRFAIQITQALMFLHTARPPRIHLDVKPANILVNISILQCCHVLYCSIAPP